MTEKIKILFVDDEPNVLQGVKRMLRSQREKWDMDFAESGKKALELMEEQSFDVVVSDMRMPLMDGAQLLTVVMERYPKTVRIILSGHSDNELILRSVGPTHQYLAKPCDADQLKDTITRACALRELLHDNKIKELVTQIKTLPSLPSFYIEVLEEINKQDSSIQKIGDIISKDVGMTAKTLQMVNSAFFGLPRQVSNTTQAVNLLGLDTIKALVLSIHVFKQYEGTDIGKRYIEYLFSHSTAVAAYARLICMEEGVDKTARDDAFLAGMLHEVGSLIMAANLPEEYKNILQLAKDKNISVSNAELEVIGSTHFELGAYLLALWGFPDPIVEALAFSHCPLKCSGQGFSPLTAVHVANIFEHEQHPAPLTTTSQLDMEYLDSLGLTDRLDAWRTCCVSVNNEEDRK